MSGKSKKDESSKKSEEQKVDVRPVQALTPFEEMDRFLENFFPRAWMHRFGWDAPVLRELAGTFESRMPRIDVIERDDEVLVRAEIPGLDKKDLDVSLTETAVTIKGRTRHETKEERDNYYRREISSGSFSRTVALPAEVDASSAKAKFKDGMLEITADKVRTAKRRTVKVE